MHALLLRSIVVNARTLEALIRSATESMVTGPGAITVKMSIMY
jgi:hypothetical protein